MNEDDYYIVMVFQRKKDIPTLRKSTVCMFQDLDKLKHIREKIPLYKTIADTHKARVYFSVNPRNMVTARKDLAVRLIQSMEEGSSNLQAQMFSSLMRCPKRENKKFLIDIDNSNEKYKDEIVKLFDEGTEVKTKNGWHLIVPAQDLRKLEEFSDVEIKKDGLTDISYLQ